jgi:hypothetical protein
MGGRLSIREHIVWVISSEQDLLQQRRKKVGWRRFGLHCDRALKVISLIRWYITTGGWGKGGCRGLAMTDNPNDT